MYLWRNLPEGQLLAVLRWMGSRRERREAHLHGAGEVAPATAEAGEKSVSPAR